MPALVNIEVTQEGVHVLRKEYNIGGLPSPAQCELMFCNVLGITDLKLSCLYSPLEKNCLSLCSSVPSSS